MIVVAHEFGHFLIAKSNGIHVVEFFIGMGPTLLSFTKGDTKYSIKLLPLGGACVFEGEDGMNTKEGEVAEGAFPNAPVWARFATVFAGPVFNFLLAYLLAVILVSNTGVLLPVVSSVQEGSSAEEAGLRVGDRIVKMDGKAVHLYQQVVLNSQLNVKGAPFEIVYERDGERDTVVIQPSYDEEARRYLMGITTGEYLKCNVLQNFQYAFHMMTFEVEMVFKSLGMLVTGQLSMDDLSGPVGIVKVVDETYTEAKTYGAATVALSMVELALLLSVNLGVMNLLPIPALDGGRLVFLLVEAVRGKPVPPEKEGIVHLAGMAVLMILMVVILFNDISKFVTP